MENFEIYQDIASRTDGDIYIGVVGPVRTGKSTFIKKFMEIMVLPNIENGYKKERAIDELPQSAGGRTIMTTEPKFIPNEAIEVNLNGNIRLRTRMVDCVGYLVNNALGYLEQDTPRMVKTPWSDKEIPFETAAELGTRKVIVEHSTIGIVVTTDGSITDIPRYEYIDAEERVVNELKELNKPFVILMNCQNPTSQYSIDMARALYEKYETPVIPLSCLELSLDDINLIFSKLLYEFMIERIDVRFPRWINGLDSNSELKLSLYNQVKDTFCDTKRLKDINENYLKLQDGEEIKKATVEEINLGTGIVTVGVELKDSLFYNMLTKITGVEIKNEGELFSCISVFSKIKKEYDKMSYALHQVNQKGYGIVFPAIDDLVLDEPEMVKHGQKFGVKLKAKAPSIHVECIKQKCRIWKKIQKHTIYTYIQCRALYSSIKQKTSFILN